MDGPFNDYFNFLSTALKWDSLQDKTYVQNTTINAELLTRN